MAAFDDHGFCAHLDDSYCRFPNVICVAQLHAGEHFGFRNIRRDDARQWDQFSAQRGDGVFFNQQITRGRHHHRIDDDIYQAMLANLLCHHVDDRSVGEHAGLDRMGADIGDDRVDLRADEFGIDGQTLP